MRIRKSLLLHAICMMMGMCIGYLCGVMTCTWTCTPPMTIDASIPSPSPFVWPEWRVDNGVFKTLSSQLLVSNRWMRVEQHAIRITHTHTHTHTHHPSLNSNNDSTAASATTMINDWLWMDEPPHVNMLVHEQSTNQYLLFYQSKYGLANYSYATAGGHMEPNGETSLTAAKRELAEEMGYHSDDWIALGSYRSSANRGGGMVTCYLARNARPLPREHQRPSSDEIESQHMIRVTKQELTRLLLTGAFGEVKWAATVALSLLYIDHHHHPQQL